MEDSIRMGMHHINYASRKSEEAALRRCQAAEWLDGLVGPLGISCQPSEREFISCLRNGQILCNAINKIQPGAVPKVVETNYSQLSINREALPLHAYQYFENVRNFLVALGDLKLPAFEASDLERDALESGSAAKIVDCVLGLKAYHEGKQINAMGRYNKHMRSPTVMHSTSRMVARTSVTNNIGSCKKLDMSTESDKLPTLGENRRIEDTIAKLIADGMVGAKENIDENLLASFSNGTADPVKLLGKVISACFNEQSPELNLVFEEYLAKKGRPSTHSTASPLEDHSAARSKCCKTCLIKGSCNHWQRFQVQEKELLVLKNLLSSTRSEFEDFQTQLQRDLKEIGTQVQEMSTAALGYYQVVRENRNLYNMVQDLKGNIRVYLRIRPIFNNETKSVVDFIGEDGSIVILDPSKPQRDGRKAFKFNKVFHPAATQGDVFADTQPLIRSVMDGYNVCIFAYGQTGSGKTHTMSGPSGGLTKDMGINYLALNDLFQLSNTRKDFVDYEIHVQMVEIYNEQVRDLLAEDSSTTKLEIRSCTGDGGSSVPTATMHRVKSTDDVINLMKVGDLNRFVSSTALNNRSSRSHSVLTIHVHGKDVSGCILRSCLHLVDLAGSERVDKSEVTGDRLKEAQYINKSLSCLGDVIMALAQKNSHIPYRNSKLTLLLQDSLGGNAKTLMFAHINPEEDSFGETVSTLKFAQRASTVELGVARANKESNEVLQLKEQVENLRKALANKEASNVQQNMVKEPRSPFEKMKQVPDQTPPRLLTPRIENSSTSTKTDRAGYQEARKMMRTPGTIRARRLSIEGPRAGRTDDLQKNGLQDGKAVSKSYGYLNHNNGSFVEEEHRSVGPRLPISQCPKSPGPLGVTCKNNVPITMQRDSALSMDPPTPASLSIAENGKGSQIRKSLRTTIGKLIPGSEKRQKNGSVEARSPIRGTSIIGNNGGSSTTVAANSRTLRRRSLTGIQTPGNRRTSLGGKPLESDSNDKGNAKTPPPILPSSKTTTRWA